MAVSKENRLRYRAILIGREVKRVFVAVPERFAALVLGRWFTGMLLRWLFLGPDDRPHRAGEIVLAHFRRRAGYGRPTNFDPDPHVMAFREGQRAVVQELFVLLNLDEGEVQKLMEVDDGLE
jgi:hypothetical protein